jgi:hypothetical protein
MATFEPLDFNQPDNKLTQVAKQIRTQQLARNDYSLENQFSSTNPDAVSDGDTKGKGTGTFLDTSAGGSSVDIAERVNNIKINPYSFDKPYQVPGT